MRGSEFPNGLENPMKKPTPSQISPPPTSQEGALLGDPPTDRTPIHYEDSLGNCSPITLEQTHEVKTFFVLFHCLLPGLFPLFSDFNSANHF